MIEISLTSKKKNPELHADIDRRVKACCDKYRALNEKLRKKDDQSDEKINFIRPYRDQSISDMYGMESDAVRKIRLKLTDHPSTRMLPVFHDAFNCSLQEIMGLEAVPLELPSCVGMYIECFKKLSRSEQRKAKAFVNIIKNRIKTRSNKTDIHGYALDNPDAIYLEKLGKFSTKPNAVQNVIRKRFAEFCEDRGLFPEYIVPYAYDSYYHSLRGYFSGVVKKIQVESLLWLEKYIHMPIDYFALADYSAYKNITINGRKITRSERQILSDYLLSGSDPGLYEMVVTAAVVNAAKTER